MRRGYILGKKIPGFFTMTIRNIFSNNGGEPIKLLALGHYLSPFKAKMLQFME
jgi:hypothetical protein